MTNRKTILLTSLGAIMILSLTGMNYASAEMTDEQDNQLDELGTAILLLQIQNQKMEEFSENILIANIIQDNEQKIAELQEEFDQLIPKRKLAQIHPTTEARMNDAIEKLIESDFPLLGMGINAETGKLVVKVNVEKATNIDTEIRNYVGENIPLTIKYVTDDVKFQGSCTSQTGFCNPIIGASFGQDDGVGQDCTISIAAEKGSIDGIVIPHHCNYNHDDYYQYDLSDEDHLVGPHHTDGGWYCDCDFVESDSRSINTAKINWDGDDVSIAANTDLAVDDAIYMIGQYSGLDFGTIEQVNQWEYIDGYWYSDLYEISGIDFDVGDSGAPIVRQSDNKYGGMNIAGGTYNYGHDWTFLKSKLGLD